MILIAKVIWWSLRNPRRAWASLMINCLCDPNEIERWLNKNSIRIDIDRYARMYEAQDVETVTAKREDLN